MRCLGISRIWVGSRRRRGRGGSRMEEEEEEEDQINILNIDLVYPDLVLQSQTKELL